MLSTNVVCTSDASIAATTSAPRRGGVRNAGGRFKQLDDSGFAKMTEKQRSQRTNLKFSSLLLCDLCDLCVSATFGRIGPIDAAPVKNSSEKSACAARQRTFS